MSIFTLIFGVNFVLYQNDSYFVKVRCNRLLRSSIASHKARDVRICLGKPWIRALKACCWNHAQAHDIPLLHCWSLAVEEQYYLVFPILLRVGWQLSGGKHAVILVAMLVLLGTSFALSVYMTEEDPDFAYYMLPTRAWELCCGEPCHQQLSPYKGTR
jgi:hypothetical protein